jgi:hypothetical protein
MEFLALKASKINCPFIQGSVFKITPLMEQPFKKISLFYLMFDEVIIVNFDK